MTSVFAARRRVEEFNNRVEGTSTGDSRDAVLAEYLEIVAHLRDVVPAEPRAEFTSALREQLMAAADTLLLPSADTQRLTLAPRRTARDRRVAALVGGLAVVGAGTSVAMAAQSALPGEMLYPLKRTLENAETGIHLSDDAKGVSLLANATDRLAEVSALSRTGDGTDMLSISTTLDSFSDQSISASELLLDDYAETGNPSSIEELRDFTASSMETLAQLETVVPEDARDELMFAAQVLGEIDAAASRACPGCAGGITQIPSALMSAGRIAEPIVVRLPPITATPDTQQGSRGPKPGDGKKSQGGQSGPTVDDIEQPPINTEAPSTGGDGGDGSSEEEPSNPLDTLTDPVTGKGGGKTTNGGGIPGIPDDIDDVIDGAGNGVPDIP